jgi:hypothetical protein
MTVEHCPSGSLDMVHGVEAYRRRGNGITRFETSITKSPAFADSNGSSEPPLFRNLYIIQ